MADEQVAEAAAKIPAFCLMISGCKDEQTSADCHDAAGQFCLPANAGPGGAGGACTTSLAWTLNKSDWRKLKWVEVLRQMRSKLDEEDFTQVPQLSCSRQIDMAQSFDLLNGGRPERAKALLVGINYVGQQGELNGCHNDVDVMRRILEERGVPRSNMRILMDDGDSPPPTRSNIIAGFAWLSQDADAGDSRFFHYSGHGGSVRDENGDEKDGKDETLCPVDYAEVGQIVDDEINKKLILAMPKDSNLICLMDCCHSGTILDLPYCVVMDGQTAEMVDAGEVPQMAPNPKFNAEKLMAIGMIAFEEFARAPHTKAGFLAALCAFAQRVWKEQALKE